MKIEKKIIKVVAAGLLFMIGSTEVAKGNFVSITNNVDAYLTVPGQNKATNFWIGSRYRKYMFSIREKICEVIGESPEEGNHRYLLNLCGSTWNEDNKDHTKLRYTLLQLGAICESNMSQGSYGSASFDFIDGDCKILADGAISFNYTKGNNLSDEEIKVALKSISKASFRDVIYIQVSSGSRIPLTGRFGLLSSFFEKAYKSTFTSKNEIESELMANSSGLFTTKDRVVVSWIENDSNLVNSNLFTLKNVRMGDYKYEITCDTETTNVTSANKKPEPIVLIGDTYYNKLYLLTDLQGEELSPQF